MALASRATAAAAAAAVTCVLLALAASAAGAGSHSPAPAPAVDCTAQAATVIDCLDYVQKGSASSRPTAACCREVKAAVASPVIVGCLCSLAGSKDLPFPIDMKRVLGLPGACGASNDAFSKCNISALSPTLSPTGAPGPSTAGGSSSGGAAASPPKAAAAGSAMTATALVAAVAAPLLAYCYLF